MNPADPAPTSPGLPALATLTLWALLTASDRSGGAAILLKLLRGKFTNVPDAVDARVRAATADELDRWAERVHTADLLDDVLR